MSDQPEQRHEVCAVCEAGWNGAVRAAQDAERIVEQEAARVEAEIEEPEAEI